MPFSASGKECVSELPLLPGEFRYYRFPLNQSGTYWMHALNKEKQQRLLAAPLIVHEPEQAWVLQDQVVLFQEFSAQEPAIINSKLRRKLQSEFLHKLAYQQDQDYDALLINRRTVSEPIVFHLFPGEPVKLRFINATNNSPLRLFFGGIEGTVTAVDGREIEPLQLPDLQLAQGQRADVVLVMPESSGVYTVLAKVAGRKLQNGLVLASPGQEIPAIASKAEFSSFPLDLELEKLLVSKQAIISTEPQKIAEVQLAENSHEKETEKNNEEMDQMLEVEFDGDLHTYVWTINGQVWPKIIPLQVKQNKLTTLRLKNSSPLPQAVFLTGHDFQVTSINGEQQRGAIRDSFYLPGGSSITVTFVTDNPGAWLVRGSIPYSLDDDLTTTINYQGIKLPQFYLDQINL